MTQTEINTVCPISKLEMKKPVRNSACGHVYDKASIEHILRQRPGSICPVHIGNVWGTKSTFS